LSPNFEVLFLKEAEDFLVKLEAGARRKIIYNLDKSRYINDPELFKKLTDIVWEFRTRYSSRQYRLFAFWDRRQKGNTLVIATHGMVKKSVKIPAKEIKKTERIAKAYLSR
jgi:phage-related protein